MKHIYNDGGRANAGYSGKCRTQNCPQRNLHAKRGIQTIHGRTRLDVHGNNGHRHWLHCPSRQWRTADGQNAERQAEATRN